MSKPYPDEEDGGGFDRYERLAELLRQTFTVAGEIAKDKGCSLPGECIIVRRRPKSDRTETNNKDVRQSLLKRRKAFNADESEDSPSPSPSPRQSQSQSPSPSPASSVQEPFSPASLAVSLDAVVEKGRATDNDLCVLDNASTAAVARFAEPMSNRSSLLSIEEGQNGLAAQTHPPQLLSNEYPPPKIPQRPSLPRKNTSMIVHSGQESLVEASTQNFVPQQIVESPRNEGLGRHRTPSYSPVRPGISKSHQNSVPALKRWQNIEQESREGNTTAASQPSPPMWHVRVLPNTSAQDLGNGSPTPSSLALMRIEAVFPLRASAEEIATSSLSYNGKPSYFIISRPPLDSSPDSPRSRADEEEIPVAKETSLQEFIDEWE